MRNSRSYRIACTCRVPSLSSRTRNSRLRRGCAGTPRLSRGCVCGVHQSRHRGSVEAPWRPTLRDGEDELVPDAEVVGVKPPQQPYNLLLPVPRPPPQPPACAAAGSGREESRRGGRPARRADSCPVRGRAPRASLSRVLSRRPGERECPRRLASARAGSSATRLRGLGRGAWSRRGAASSPPPASPRRRDPRRRLRIAAIQLARGNKLLGPRPRRRLRRASKRLARRGQTRAAGGPACVA